jgi:iron complex outermembrane receptor protein
MMLVALQQGRSPARPRRWQRVAGGMLAILVATCAAAEDNSTSALKKLSVEELMSLDVTSVSKTAEPLSAAPAAVYVITHDEAVRSGATSLPELLRLAPNLQVVQISASNYTITARGFSGNAADQNFSDKLLVLIDGRSVYSPLYSGVYWDSQDLVIGDIDRIEVISGPGATLWGANAMNGVINIITRRSSDTAGATLNVGVGNLEKGGAGQYGGALGSDASYRVYAKGFERRSLDLPNGTSADDGWSKVQIGFRSDWTPGTDSVTVSGDVYRANEDQAGTTELAITGANLLARWQRQFVGGSSLQVQAYYDETQRFNGGGGGAFVLNTYDLEVQHTFAVGGNEVVWGAGDRVSTYGITNTTSFLFLPAHRTLNLANAFVQDTVSIRPRLKLTVGAKLEDDPYTGTTPLPSVRLAWNASERTLLWSSASRAIRSATPFDRDVAEYLGSTLFLVGGANFRPEKLTAYELGYRGNPFPAATLSVSTYYNVYDDLRTIEINPRTVLPLQWGNLMKGDTYGGELWLNYQASDAVRLTFTYVEMREHLKFKAGSSALLGVAQAGDDPRRQASLRASIDVTPEVSIDTILRFVGSLPEPAVGGYEELNVRLGWHLSRSWDAALTGTNLLHAHHQEFTVPPSESIGRSALVDLRYRY